MVAGPAHLLGNRPSSRKEWLSNDRLLKLRTLPPARVDERAKTTPRAPSEEARKSLIHYYLAPSSPHEKVVLQEPLVVSFRRSDLSLHQFCKCFAALRSLFFIYGYYIAPCVRPILPILHAITVPATLESISVQIADVKCRSVVPALGSTNSMCRYMLEQSSLFSVCQL